MSRRKFYTYEYRKSKRAFTPLDMLADGCFDRCRRLEYHFSLCRNMTMSPLVRVYAPRRELGLILCIFIFLGERSNLTCPLMRHGRPRLPPKRNQRGPIASPHVLRGSVTPTMVCHGVWGHCAFLSEKKGKKLL